MNKTSNIIIKVDQALHGYRNGHSLISSSADLSYESKRNMLIMSDMSGQSMIKGFEEYITGYPLNDMGLYVIAKTWYAPEMKRPGCVWTHSLMMKFSDLIYFDNSCNLLDLFIKPKDSPEEEIYTKTASVLIDDKKISSLPRLDDINQTIEILYNLYCENGLSIYLSSDSSNLYESLLLDIWYQQWPRLKRNFTFCTGSISPRTLNSKNLDVQIGPAKENSLKPAMEFKFLSSKINSFSNTSIWAENIYNDLIHPSGLRNFVKNYGADIRATRSYFSILSEFYSKVTMENENIDCDEIIKFLSHHFPEPDEAIGLKSMFLKDRKYLNSHIFYSEENVLFALCITKYYKSFDSNKLLLKDRLQYLFKENKTKAFDLINRLIRYEINLVGVEFIEEIALKLTQNDVSELNSKYRDLLPIFIKLNPLLSLQESYWQGSTELQKENFLLSIRNVNQSNNFDWQGFTNIIISQKVEIDDELLDNCKSSILPCVLNWVNTNDSSWNGYSWSNYLSYNPEIVLEWLLNHTHLSERMVLLVIKTINPNSSIVLKHNAEIWNNIILDLDNSISKDVMLKFKAFLLAMSLNIPSTGVKLFRFSFEEVYKALDTGWLDYDSWKRIECHTKPLRWRDWDRCQKLVLAIKEKVPSSWLE